MDLSKVKELIELMNKHQLAELEIEQEGTRVRLCKKDDRPKEIMAMPAALPVGMPMTAGIAMPGVAAGMPAEPLGPTIDSPMVGTFYASPNPDADL